MSRACEARGCPREGYLRRPHPLDPACSVVVCEVHAARWHAWLTARPAARLAAFGDSDAARELARRRSTRSPR